MSIVYCVLTVLTFLIFFPATRNANLIKEAIFTSGICFCWVLALMSLHNPGVQRRVYLRFCLFLSQYRRWLYLSLVLCVYLLVQSFRTPDFSSAVLRMFQIVVSVLALVLIVLFVYRQSHRTVLMESVCWMGTLSCLYIVIQYLGLDFLDWNDERRPGGTFANPNFSSQALVGIFPLMLGWEMMRYIKHRYHFRWFPYRSALVPLVLMMTLARGAIIGFSIAVVLMLIFRQIFNQGRTTEKATGSLRIYYLVFTLFLSICAFVVFTWFPERLLHLGAYTTIQVRMGMYEGGWILFKQAPLFGHGFESLSVVFQQVSYVMDPIVSGRHVVHCHSWVLETMVETGIVGLFLFLGWIGLLLLKWYSGCAEPIVIFCGISCISLLSACLFGVWMDWWGGMWLLFQLISLGISFSLSRRSEKIPRLSWLGISLLRSGSRVLAIMVGCLFLFSLTYFYHLMTNEYRLFRADRLIGTASPEQIMELLPSLDDPIRHDEKLVFNTVWAENELGNHDRALEVTHEYLRAHKQKARFWRLKGNVYVRKQDLQKAEDAFATAWILHPDGTYAKSYFHLLAAQGKYAKAESVLETQLSRSFSMEILHDYLTLKQKRHGNESARKFLTSLIENPSHKSHRNNKSVLLRWKGELAHLDGDLPEALVSYRMSIFSDPKNGEVWNELGIVLKELGSYHRADQAFIQAEKYIKGASLPTCNRLEIAMKVQDYEKAQEILSELKKNQWENLPDHVRKRLESIDAYLSLK